MLGQSGGSGMAQGMGRPLALRMALLVMALLALCLLAVPAQAARDGGSEQVRVELLPEWDGVPAEGGSFWIALRQSIIPGWHTYWLNPGDSGQPTEIRWDLPAGGSVEPIVWPHPQRLPYGPLVNFGYEREVVLLSRVTLPGGLTPGSRVPLEARVRWLACEEICIPQEADLALSLPVVAGAAQPDPAAGAVIGAALGALPQPSPWPVTFDVVEGRLVLGVAAPETANAFASGRVDEVVFFPEPDGLIVNATAQTAGFGEGGFTVATDAGFKLVTEGITPPERFTGLLVIAEMVNGERLERAVSFEATRAGVPPAWMAAVPAARTPSSGGGSVLQALGLAVLGGLILNLMPCVFPVLFMKAFGFVEAARENPWQVRAHGMAFTFGVLVSFAVVGGALIALRAAGEQIGWGFQLQSPAVVTALIYLLLAVGLSFSGVFDVGRSLVDAGSEATRRGGLVGPFFTGVLATLVATPCTAPFMGTAIGFGLTQSSAVALGIFLALGFGMALPWLVLSFSPGLLRLLPRPGAWMEFSKKFLAFPIYATAAWLLWVLTQQVGADGLAAALAGAVLIAFAAWLYGQVQDGPGGWRRVGGGLAVMALGGALALLWPLNAATPPASAVTTSDTAQADYEPYSAARLAALRAEGTPVLINATAAWCITCLVNERVALSAPAVVADLEARGVAYLKADWTNRDPEITRLLDQFSRSGVPLYVLYPSGQEAAPVVLPQLLTEAILLDALERI